MSDIEMISNNSVFNHLNDNDQHVLLKSAVVRTYSSGQWILHYGDIWPYIFLVSKGSITAVKESSEGRSLFIETVSPGDILWGMAFFEPGAIMPVGLKTNNESRLLIWHKDEIKRIFHRNGDAIWELCRLVVNRVQRASDILEELAFQPVAGRLAGFLVDHFGGVDGDRIARTLTLDEMAAYIGSTREMVCRVLHKFSNLGYIEITRTDFVFTNCDGLKEITKNIQGNIK